MLHQAGCQSVNRLAIPQFCGSGREGCEEGDAAGVRQALAGADTCSWGSAISRSDLWELTTHSNRSIRRVDVSRMKENVGTDGGHPKTGFLDPSSRFPAH